MVSTSEYQATVAAGMTEAQLQRAVTALAKQLGWRVFHVTWSPGTTPGWPDLVLIHPTKQRVVFRELKTARGRLSAAQLLWLGDLTAAGQDAGVWRPADLMAGTIRQELS